MRGTLAITLVALLIGCGSNTQCTVGRLACSNNQVRRCVGPSGGGDADGEFVEIVTDCAGMGLTCQLGVNEGGTQYGVCATTACIGSHHSRLCPTIGNQQCDLGDVEICAMGADGCLAWTTGTECMGGQTCTESGGAAACAD